MRIVLSSRVYDLSGVMELEVDDAASDFGEISRRVNRVPTLDGGVAINDGGFSWGDRTIELVWKSDNYTRELNVQRLIRLNPIINVFMPDGAYSAAPENYSSDKTDSTLTLLIQSKISE